MYANKINIFVILSLSIATVMMGTIALSVLSPVFAGGDSNVKDIDQTNSSASILGSLF